jgi:hypothetical protein
VSRQPNYTAEVLEAMREQGLLPPEPSPPPVGELRYLIAVGESRVEGVAVPSIIAAALRAQADALDQP